MKNLSPHLTIYKFPITAISSITNRVTGLAMTGLFIGYGLSKYYSDDKFEKKTIQFYNDSNYLTKNLMLTIPTFPTVYHTMGGIRHIILDKYPKYLNNGAMFKSSVGIFVGSILLTTMITNYSVYSSNKKNDVKS